MSKGFYYYMKNLKWCEATIGLVILSNFIDECEYLVYNTVGRLKEVMKMLFMVTETYPTKSSVEAGKVAVEAYTKAPPPYVKTTGLYLALGGDGIKSYAIYEIEKGHVDEGYKGLLKVYVPFFNIEGWKFAVEPLLPVKEALPLVGL